jgi:hypothetical protein
VGIVSHPIWKSPFLFQETKGGDNRAINQQ